MEKQDKTISNCVSSNNTVRKSKIPTQLNITINIPITNEQITTKTFVKTLEQKVLNMSCKRIKKNKRKYNTNIKSIMPNPIKEETIDTISEDRNEMCHMDNFYMSNIDHVMKQSTSEHNPSYYTENIEDIGTYTSFTNGLNTSGTRKKVQYDVENTDIPFSLNTFLDRVDEKIKDSNKKLLENSINYEIVKENISLVNETSILNAKTDDEKLSEDMLHSKLQKDLNSSVDIPNEKIDNKEISSNSINNYCKSLSVIYENDDSSFQYLTPKKRKHRTSLCETHDFEKISFEKKKKGASDHDISGTMAKEKEIDIPVFEEMSAICAEKQNHKSKKRKKKIYGNTESHILPDDLSSNEEASNTIKDIKIKNLESKADEHSLNEEIFHMNEISDTLINDKKGLDITGEEMSAICAEKQNHKSKKRKKKIYGNTESHILPDDLSSNEEASNTIKEIKIKNLESKADEHSLNEEIFHMNEISDTLINDKKRLDITGAAKENYKAKVVTNELSNILDPLETNILGSDLKKDEHQNIKENLDIKQYFLVDKEVINEENSNNGKIKNRNNSRKENSIIETTTNDSKVLVEENVPKRKKKKLINDFFPLQSTQESETKSLKCREIDQLQMKEDVIDYTETTISNSINQKCTTETHEDLKKQSTKKSIQVKAIDDGADVNNASKKVNTNAKKIKAAKIKSKVKKNMDTIMNYETSEDEEDNYDSVMDFVKSFVKDSKNFKMNETQLNNSTDNNCMKKKPSNLFKIYSDSSDDSTSDNLLSGFAKQKSFVKNAQDFKMNERKLKENPDKNCTNKKSNIKSSNLRKICSDSSDGFTSDDSIDDFVKHFHNSECKEKDQGNVSKKKTKTNDILKMPKENSLLNYINISKKEKEGVEIVKSTKHNQCLRDDLKESSPVSNICPIKMSTPSQSQRDISDNKTEKSKKSQKKNVTGTSTKPSKSRTNAIVISQNKSIQQSACSTNNLDKKKQENVEIVKDKNNITLIQVHNTKSKSSPNESKTSNQEKKCTSGVNSAKIDISKFIKPEKSKLKKENGNNSQYFESVEHLASTSTGHSADQFVNNKTEEQICNYSSRNLSYATIADKSHKGHLESANLKIPNKEVEQKKLKNEKKRNMDGESEKNISKKKLILDYFDKILRERFDKVPLKYKSPAFVKDSDYSSDNSMHGVSDFKTDKDSDDEETGSKMFEIISRAEDKLLNVMEENEELKTIKIDICWDVPFSHTIETRVSSCPTREQRDLFETFNLKMKVGPFTKAEDDAITNNFKEFCTVYELKYDPIPFLNFKYGTVDILPKKERINFARYIGRGLDNRMLFCIYNRFKTIYSNFRKGRFEPPEDAIIMEYMKINKDTNKQFSSLSKILQRPRLAIEKRYKTLLKESKRLTATEYWKFVTCLIEVANVEGLEGLRDRYITDEEWTKVSKMLNICSNNLKLCWTASLYSKLFHNGPICVDKIMRKLLARLDAAMEDDYRKLNWGKLAEPFEGITRGFLYRLFKRCRKAKVPVEKHSNLREVVIYLKKLYDDTEEDVMDDIPNIILDI